MSLQTMEKLLNPVIERNRKINRMTKEEKIEYIKQKYGLTHGKGKKKKRK